ncbi:NB protein, partial [Influenza B virus]
LSESTSN